MAPPGLQKSLSMSMTSTAVRRASSLIAVSTLWAENSSMFTTGSRPGGPVIGTPCRPPGKRISCTNKVSTLFPAVSDSNSRLTLRTVAAPWFRD